jgi:hypothetical protein
MQVIWRRSSHGRCGPQVRSRCRPAAGEVSPPHAVIAPFTSAAAVWHMLVASTVAGVS